MNPFPGYATTQFASPRAFGWLEETLAVLRLAFTLRLDAHRLVAREASIALHGAVALVVWMLLGRREIDGPAVLHAAGIAELVSIAGAVSCLAWLVGRSSRPPLGFRHCLWLIAGYLPAVAAVAWLLSQPLPATWFAAIASIAITHAALFFFFGLRALGARAPWLSLGVLAVGVAAFMALNQRSSFDFLLWSPRLAPDELADYRESELRAEELMYLQPERISAALAGMSAAAKHGDRVFFVGFAGFGPQKVFTEEISLAARRVDERYDIADRRVLLINDRRDYDRHPVASSTALERTLQGVGARMNLERDVLFLALSSHGKKDPYLVVENGALPLNELTAERLTHMLRASRIRWKVLIISACYAGAFIEHLRDPHTIIITAAAADKTSFGCDDRRALTYFGEAFYRDALPAAASLREAFESAVTEIERRERAEGLEPSLPQAHFGAAMERKLAEIEALRSSPGPQPAERAGEHQRIDQPVEHQLERGAPLARVPDGVVQQAQ